MKMGMGLGIILLLMVAWAFFMARDHGARELLREKPSEKIIQHQFGYNPYCGSYHSVGFWQQGPTVEERQGFICGGVISDRYLVTVPFHEGLTISNPL